MTITEKLILTVFILSIVIAVILAFNGTKNYKP